MCNDDALMVLMVLAILGVVLYTTVTTPGSLRWGKHSMCAVEGGKLIYYLGKDTQ